MKLHSRAEYFRILVTATFAYLYQSASNEKLLFVGSVLTAEANKYVLNNSMVFLIPLGLLYLVLSYVSNSRVTTKKDNKAYSNIARYIFKKAASDLPPEDKSTVRVTIFKAMRPETSNAELLAVSRYQTRMPIKKTRIKFKPGEGCAGMCFKTQTIISKQIESYEADQEKYTDSCHDELGIPKNKLKLLNEKSCSFLCIPLKCFDTEQTWGVLVIDSTKKELVLDNKARELEECLSHYSTFFSYSEV